MSKKTHTYTRVKLPEYCVKIIGKYPTKKGRIFPMYSLVNLNKYSKELCELAGWTEHYPKIRMRRGMAVNVYRTKSTNTPYRFCDLISSHTMRRTAITTMLSLGMREELVRNISGHAPGSKEFWRYVSHAQSYMDDEIDLVHSALKKRKLTAV